MVRNLNGAPQVGSDERVLIVGGYGRVGHLIATELAEICPGSVHIAGRDAAEARAWADKLGHCAHAVAFDVSDPESVHRALSDKTLVVNCVDQKEPHLLAEAVRRGIAYTDITADQGFWREALTFEPEARRSGARVLLGAGLIPGIANVMAGAGRAVLKLPERVETYIYLSLLDTHGPAAVDYMLHAAEDVYTITVDGEEHSVRSFEHGSETAYPSPLGTRQAFTFAFPSQQHYPRTLGVQTAVCYLTLVPDWIGHFAHRAARLGGASLIKRGFIRAAFKQLAFLLGHLDRDERNRYALVVEVYATIQGCRYSIIGKVEAEITAHAATTFSRGLLDRTIDEPGVWLPEQIVDPDWFFTRLAQYGLEVNVEAIPANNGSLEMENELT